MKKIAYLAIALALCACSGNKTQMPAASNDFAVETVQATDATLTTSYPATIKGVQDIEIRPKIAGHITKVLVDEGDFVRAGQPLFLIDRVQYEAMVKSAQAAINVVRTNIATQQLTVNNKKQLLDKQIISKYDYDVANNQLQTLKAQLAQCEASLVEAKNNLRYCTITCRWCHWSHSLSRGKPCKLFYGRTVDNRVQYFQSVCLLQHDGEADAGFHEGQWRHKERHG